MSDRPNDRNPENTERRSGWRVPERTPDKSAGSRQSPQPEEPADISTWRVPSLPRDLSVEPESRGAWHLPRPEDTKYRADDESIIPTDQPPAGAVASTDASKAEPADQAQTPPADDGIIPFDGERDAGSDVPTASSESPADVNVDAEKVAAALAALDDDDEDDSFSMSELIALASLADAVASKSGSSSGAPDEDTQTDAATGMVSAADESDSAAYARRQLEILQRAAQASAEIEPEAASPAVPAATAAQPAEQQGIDAQEYARQQLARLQGGAAAVPQQPAVAPAGAALTPEERVLAQKFHDAEARVRDLRRSYNAAQIDRAQFEQGLRASMVLDDSRIYWMLGTESDRWYKHENGQWIPATPEVLDKETSGGGSGGFFTAAPEFDADQTVPTTTITDDAWIPRQVPVGDPEATVAGTGGIFLNTSQATVPAQPIGDQMTVPGRAYTEVTVPSAPVNQYESIASPVNAAQQAADAAALDLGLYQDALERQRQNTARSIAIAAAIIAGVIFLVGTGLVILAVSYYNNLADPYRGAITALAAYQPQFQTARILAVDNSVIAELTSPQGGARTKINLSQMSPEIIHAIVSVENERYFQDPGFDVVAIGRAFIQNLSTGDIESGATTITQGIARNLILQDTTISPERKLQEIVIAAEIARQYDKNFILQLYLNEIYFGNQSYGVEAASEFYFHHPAADLNLPEAALLAGLIQAPAKYDPVVNRTETFSRMDQILQRMAEVGCLQFQHTPYDKSPFCVTASDINPSNPTFTYQKALIESANFPPRQAQINYPHFVNYIQQVVEADFGTSEMFRRGFEIHTTLIPRLQQTAQSALQQQVAALSVNGVNTGAVMVTDPRDGAIRAMIGSPNFNDVNIDGQVNNVFTWQQPGSSIKPVVYAAALDGVDQNGTRQYLTPATILWDVPSSYTNPDYTPINYDRQFHGPIGLRYAFANSYNIPAVKTYAFIGNENFVATANRMGLNFLDGATFGLPSALGANEVRLYDMVQMYGTIADNGIHVPLYAITGIKTSDGQDVALPAPATAPAQVIQPQVAFLLQNILSDNAARSAAFGANSALNLPNYANQVAAKTGTTNDNRDLWTMGFSRNYVVGVWIGRHDNAPTVNTSGLAAAPIWNAVMSTALSLTTAPGVFAPPQGIVQQDVCVETGTVYDANNPTPGCRSVRKEYFIANSPPAAANQSFVQTVAIDTWTGLRANQFCPDNRDTRTFANISDLTAVAWLNTPAGQTYAQSIGLPTTIQAAPAGECTQSTVNPQVRFTNLADGQQINGLVQIQGIVTAPDFQSFRLEFAPATSPNGYQLIGSYSAQQPGGTLATWDTTSMQNGAYTLRLTVTSTNGGTASRMVNIGINNQPTPMPTSTDIPIIIPTFDPNATLIPFPTAIPFSAQGASTATPGFVPMGGLSNTAPTPTIKFN